MGRTCRARSGQQSHFSGIFEVYTPASVVTSLANRNTSQVCADTQHDKPLRPLRTRLIALGVTQGLPVVIAGLVDLLLRAVTDENGLSSPLDDDVLSDRDASQLNLNLREGEDVGGRRHSAEELGDRGLGDGRREDTERADHEVGDAALGGVGLRLVRREVGDVVGVLCDRGGGQQALLEHAGGLR